MSYCRWSTDDFKCDLYAYEGDKYYIHVAANRHTIPYDEMKELDWDERYKHMEPIGLPCDGETFGFETLQEFKNKFLELRKMGYRFPDRVLGRIQEEIEEEKAQLAKFKANTSLHRP